MMKFGILFIIPFIVANASAQTIDSAVILQVDSLIRVSRDLVGKNDFSKALEVNAAAEKLALEKLGGESTAFGNCCMAHGSILYYHGEFAAAEPWYLKAKLIRERTVGKEHPDYANILNNLAVLYKNMGHYEKAEMHYLETIAINEKKLGKGNPDYCWVASNLANLYKRMGRFDIAELLFLESMGIAERTWGKNHPEYATSLSNLSQLYHDRGQLAKAEVMALEAKIIREQTLGKEDPDYAESLNNLANLYADLGQYDKAQSYYLEEQALYGRILGKKHPDYAMCLVNLVMLNLELHQFEKALPLLEEAITIQETTLGKDHPDYTVSLSLRASLYMEKGLNEKAVLSQQEAMDILERHVGKQHPDYLSKQINLASLLVKMGQYKKAELHLLEAKRIFETGLVNREHVNYLNCLVILSNLYASLGQYEKAEPFIVEQAALSRKLLENAKGHLSERELNEYIKLFSQRQDYIKSYIQSSGSARLAGVCFDNSLFYKGILLMAVSQLRHKATADPTTAAKCDLLRANRQRLSAQYTMTVADQDKALVKQLEEKTEEIEKDLARTVAGWGAGKEVLWQDVQSMLKTGELAVEFVHYRYFSNLQTDSTMYAALVLRAGDAQPQFIPLFEEKELDHLLSTNKERKADYVNDLYSWADRGLVKLGQEKMSLYELIWAKIEAAGLEGIKTIYFSASGVLHRLNLGAIAIDDETILSDRYNMVSLNSTRQLVIPSTVTTQANDAVLAGGINFEVDTLNFIVEDEALIVSRSSLSSRSESDTRGESWPFLMWTEREVERIQTSLVSKGYIVDTLIGINANEETIKSKCTGVVSPRILHIATHGFFFPDPQIKTQGIGLGESDPVFKSSDNPMIRSGLILAGGNYAWKNGKQVSSDEEDGILTAYEISQMNLSNTELVVLSACETGLGDIQGNEGVYGLQRAFKIAGAKYLIMSLWQVPDRETMEFMTAFYKNWLEGKLTIPDAFRKTQREMRDRFINPYSWGAFVLLE